MSNDVVFCIPVRGGSKRIPRKNLLVLDGETLIARKIRQLSWLGTVVVGSDDDEMLEEASRHGAIAVRRTKTNEGRDSANDMIGEFMELIEPIHPSTVVWAHCTNALLSTQTYSRALDSFWKGTEYGYDSLVSVKESKEHYWSFGKPLYDLESCRRWHICANELAPLYFQDGGIFINWYSDMKRHHYFFGELPQLFVIPNNEFMDINTPEDWECCKALYEYYNHPR